MSVVANGIAFDVVEQGSGDPAIVLIHGFACDASAWAPQIEDLSRDHRCLAVNLRGRGGTPATPPFGVEQQAADVAAVIDALGVTSAIIIGHSLGGIVALLLNELRTDLVRAVAAIDSPLRPQGLDGTLTAASIRETGSTEAIRGLVESFWSDGTSEVIRGQVREMMLGCPPEVAAGMLETPISPGRMLDLVRGADQKTFMTIWAERPLGDPAWLRDQTLFLRQEPVPGTGHFVQLEQPAVTNALLRAFLEEAERDPRTGG